MENIPQHIAIIMDGNGRWAKKRGLPRTMGHQAGVEALRGIVKACVEFGVKYLSVYAFSTENWERPEDEVNFIMSLLGETIDREVDELNKNGVCIRFLGRLTQIPHSIQKKISEAMAKTSHNTKLNLNIMLNYGGRAEILDALKQINHEQLPNEQISEEMIGRYLYTREIPDPDLLIRTAGEVRVSNFLLWQAAYSEFYFTETLWPDFKKENLRQAILEYQKRARRFGKVA